MRRRLVIAAVVASLLLVTVTSAMGSPSARASHRPLALARLAASCRHGRLPDRRCTPGATSKVGRSQVCVPGYSERVRDVPESEKRQVYAEYGIRTHKRGQYEVDHLIALELGGSNSILNLWPEAANPRPGFHEKDRLENKLHRLVCAGKMALRKAQNLIASNWVAAYNRYG